MHYNGELTCAIGVTDIKRAIDWYQSVLDFKLLYHAEAVAWGELSTGVANVTLGLGQVETVPQGGGATLVWGVTDIVAAKAELEAKGVRTAGEIEHIPGLVKLLDFYDPDGNAMKIFEADQP